LVKIIKDRKKITLAGITVIAFPDGRSYTTDGLVLNNARDDFLESIKSGQIFISDLMTSSIDGAPSVYIGVPIYKYGSPAASLGYELKRERLNNLLQKLLSEDGKYSYFMDEHGEFVAFVADSNINFSPENNLFYVLGRHTYGTGLSKELVMADFANVTEHALMCIDLDNFKSINDLFGHLYGDNVLKEAAGIMKNLFRSDDVLGRFGGDEFVIFVRAIPNIDFVKEKAAELNSRLNKTYEKDGVECTVSASIGIAIFPSDGTAYSVLHQKADEASYAAKKSGKNTYRFAAAPDGNTNNLVSVDD
jgi:diguanylate cyclase (GGDEF)-like protein